MVFSYLKLKINVYYFLLMSILFQYLLKFEMNTGKIKVQIMFLNLLNF